MAGGSEPVKKGQTRVSTVTMTLPAEVSFEPGNRTVDTSDWISYEHKAISRPAA